MQGGHGDDAAVGQESGQGATTTQQGQGSNGQGSNGQGRARASAGADWPWLVGAEVGHSLRSHALVGQDAHGLSPSPYPAPALLPRRAAWACSVA